MVNLLLSFVLFQSQFEIREMKRREEQKDREKQRLHDLSKIQAQASLSPEEGPSDRFVFFKKRLIIN